MNRPYLVVFGEGDQRAADFVFLHKDGGACFVDLFWNTAGQHPFHILQGPVVQHDNYWQLGKGVIIRELRRDDPQWQTWLDWQEYKASPEGRNATDQKGIECCQRDGAII